MRSIRRYCAPINPLGVILSSVIILFGAALFVVSLIFMIVKKDMGLLIYPFFVIGMLLILFGCSALFSYTNDKRRKFNQTWSELEDAGRTSDVLADFKYGKRFFGNRMIVGKKYIIVRSDSIYRLEDIDMFQLANERRLIYTQVQVFDKKTQKYSTNLESYLECVSNGNVIRLCRTKEKFWREFERYARSQRTDITVREDTIDIVIA